MKISIVTTNFNGAKYLEATILSVLSQNYPEIEYIIVDGGSTDGSVEIIKKYEKQLAWWISEPDNGMYYAIQKGFDHSTGEIMAWINSDDMYHKNSFYTIAEIFSSFEQVNWLVGASTFYDEKGRTVICNQSRLLNKFDFYNYDYKWIQQESVFWRRNLWEKAGSHLNVNLKYAGDFDLWLRFFQIDKLFFTYALIGGFRLRGSDQLSLDHVKEYFYEANSVLSNVKLSNKEKKDLLNYQRLIKIESYSKRLRLYRTLSLFRNFRSKFFAKPPVISFDRIKQKFVLID
jgi:glycosyltransferase involved in cell wall biosynthesis